MSITYHGEVWELGDVLVPLRETRVGATKVSLVCHAKSEEYLSPLTGLFVDAGSVLVRGFDGREERGNGRIWQAPPKYLTKLKPNALPAKTTDVETPEEVEA